MTGKLFDRVKLPTFIMLPLSKQMLQTWRPTCLHLPKGYQRDYQINKSVKTSHFQSNLYHHHRHLHHQSILLQCHPQNLHISHRRRRLLLLRRPLRNGRPRPH